MANPNIELDVLTASLSEWRFSRNSRGTVDVERMTINSMRYQLIAVVADFPVVYNGDRISGDDLRAPVGQGHFVSNVVIDHYATVLP